MALLFGLVLGGEDFYSLLKIDRDADTAQIKKAFRKMSLEYHPDKNPGKFAQVYRECRLFSKLF